MSGKFKGKNNNKSLVAQTTHRATYYIKAFENFHKNGKIHESVTDFNFSERVYYGRIDDDGDPVIPKSDSLSPLDGGGKPGEMKIVLATVKKMIEDFKSKFSSAVRVGNIPGADTFLSEIKVYKAYESPILLYQAFVLDVARTFNEVYLGDPKIQDDIMNFDDYVRHFILYIELLGDKFPVTLTGFQKSARSNIFTSGATISIADLDCSNDSEKERFFLENPCMEFYLNVAKQYGLSIMKNAPWILVADFDSVSTKLYTNDSTPRQIFQGNYLKTYKLDLNYLPDIIRKSYNEFVNAFSYKKEISVCNKSTNATNIYRETINNNTFNIKYNLKYWIPLYIRLRNIEDEKPYSEQAIFRMIQKAISFQKLLDNDQAMSYINEQFRVKYKFAEGGFAYYYDRFKKKQEGQ